jgi:hypothetical protein
MIRTVIPFEKSMVSHNMFNTADHIISTCTLLSMTEDYLPAARRLVKEQTQKSQHSIKEFFARRNTL